MHNLENKTTLVYWIAILISVKTQVGKLTAILTLKQKVLNKQIIILLTLLHPPMYVAYTNMEACLITTKIARQDKSRINI